MELEAGTEAAEFALGPGDDRFGKVAGQAHRNDARPAGIVAHRSEQHGVAKRRARGRRIDGKDIPAPGKAGP